MTGRLSKLQQDLANIETEVAELALKIQERYRVYLELLGEVLYKQAIVAVYHLCTQAYPGEFLALSHADRQKLQEHIKTLAGESRTGLRQLGEIELDKSTLNALRTSTKEVGIEQKKLFELLLEKDRTTVPDGKIDNPDALARWCRAMEKSATDIIAHLSGKINYQLQQAYILPSRLSRPVLDRDALAESAGSESAGEENFWKKMIEAVNLEEEEEEEEEEKAGEEREMSPGIARITTVHLRLSEIEFADSRLTIERHQLRSLQERLGQVRSRYSRTYREYTIARADAAWRGSWYE